MEIIIITVKIASQLELSQQFCPRLLQIKINKCGCPALGSHFSGGKTICNILVYFLVIN